jgi:hypothetical protein
MIDPQRYVLNYRKPKRIGPGDVIAKATTVVVIKSCGGCKSRQQRLNKWWFDLADKLSDAMK